MQKNLTNVSMYKLLRLKVRKHGEEEQESPASSMTAASSSADTSRLGGRRRNRHEARKRTEGAAADGVKHGDTASARVDHDPVRQTSFDDKDSIEPPALPI